MRILGIVALGAALVGCAASRQEVAARLGDQFIGQNVDSLVVQFGPPTSSFKNEQWSKFLHLATYARVTEAKGRDS
jgi:hypothetical protein